MKKNKTTNEPATAATASTFQIESGVPIPPRSAARTSDVRDALTRMFSGDSVVVTKNQAALFRNHSKKLSIPISCRRVGDGFRVWRD